jgi:hypothetical protein
MKLTIFGPNLRDQSKGTFVVHAAGCADCAKLKREIQHAADHDSEEAVARDIYADMLPEGLTVAEALAEIHFAPCVKF